MTTRRFPEGWDETRVRRLLEYYDSQSEEEAVAEDEAAYEDPSVSVMLIPNELVPEVQKMLGRREKKE